MGNLSVFNDCALTQLEKTCLNHKTFTLNRVLSPVNLFQLDISVKEGRDKVREMFMKNAHVTDPRVVDLLVIKVTGLP